MAETYPPEAAVGLTSTEAAARLGISERTLRERIKSGKIRAIKVFNPNGNAMYRVFLDDAPEAEKLNPSATTGDSPVMEESTPEAEVSLPGAELSSLAVVIDRMRQELTRLNDERAELYGRLGYFQAQLEVARGQLQVAQARILELEAPKEAPAETANHPPAERNGQDWSSQVVSAMREEQPEAGRRSEVSAPPAVNGQEGGSAGPFKRFWRWLTQPV